MQFTLNGKTYRYTDRNDLELKKSIFEYALTHSTRETIDHVRAVRFSGSNCTDDDCINFIKDCTPQKLDRGKFKDIKLNIDRNDEGIIYKYSLKIEDDDGTVKEISYVGKSYNE